MSQSVRKLKNTSTKNHLRELCMHYDLHASRHIALQACSAFGHESCWQVSMFVTMYLVPHHATRRLCVIPKKWLTYFSHFTYVGGGGVGCNDMHCHAHNCTCAHARCYAITLAHMLDATQLHLRTCWMPRNLTCAHVRCYAIALAHMFDATQLHLRTCSMLRNCTCAHVGCHARQ